MCISKIINEFEVYCPLDCGIRIKKGDLKMHMEKYCTEKLYECTECSQKFKKDALKYHILKEHQDTMLNKFLKKENEESKTDA